MSQGGGVQVERLDAIRSHLYTHGFSNIQALADATGASLATIRRDLQVLEREGTIDRVHGGARIANGSSIEMAFQERTRAQPRRQARHRGAPPMSCSRRMARSFSMPAPPCCNWPG